MIEAILPLIALSVSVNAYGWEKPALYRNMREANTPGEVLSTIKIEVAGKEYVVANNQTLDFHPSDKIVIREAELGDKSTVVESVNLVGYKRKTKGGHFLDDRGEAIDAREYLGPERSHWCVDTEKKLFLIAVSTGKTLHGQIFLRRNESLFKYMEVMVNGEPRVMREGEVFVLKGSDQIDWGKVRTNRGEEKDLEVKFVLFPAHPEESPTQPTRYEVRLERKDGSILAKIPVLVENL